MQIKSALSILAENKPLDLVIDKALEELAELSLALLHYKNKGRNEIPGEIYDVEMHLFVLKKFFPITDQLRSDKIIQFYQSKSFKKYVKPNL